MISEIILFIESQNRSKNEHNRSSRTSTSHPPLKVWQDATTINSYKRPRLDRWFSTKRWLISMLASPHTCLVKANQTEFTQLYCFHQIFLPPQPSFRDIIIIISNGLCWCYGCTTYGNEDIEILLLRDTPYGAYIEHDFINQ